MPEYDPELINEKRVASRFLELVNPSPDHPERPVHHEPLNYQPPLRASHTFATKDDVVGRDDPDLSKTLVGSLDDVWPELDKLNRSRRAGVFVVLSPDDAIVADFNDEPRVGFPVEPSLQVTSARSRAVGESSRITTYIWLLAGDPLPPKDRADICAMLRTAGANNASEREALVRLPGTHVRLGRSVLALFKAAGNHSGTSAPRYSAAELARGFLKIEEDAALTN